LNLHYTSWRPSLSVECQPNNSIKEIGLDGCMIDSWTELFYLSKIFPKLKKITCTDVKLLKSERVDEEKYWDVKFQWKVLKSGIVLCVVLLIFPDLEIFNYKENTSFARNESAKYINALIRRRHPIIDIAEKCGVYFKEMPSVAQIGISFDNDNDEVPKSITNSSTKILFTIEPSSSLTNETELIFNADKFRVPISATIGRIIEAYMRRQSINIKFALNLTIQGCEPLNNDPDETISSWLERYDIILNERDMEVTATLLKDKIEVKSVGTGVGLRRKV